MISNLLGFFKKIDPFIFLISLCIGLFFTYSMTPPPEIVYKYPTPENSGKISYKDRSNMCYKYNSKEVQCPDDIKKISQYPFQSEKNEIKKII